MKTAVLLAWVCLTAGCASTAPLQKDKNYPAAWPDLATLGSDGRGLEGAYANAGVATGDAKPAILLTSLLPETAKIRPTEAKVVSLKIVPGKPDARGDSQARLQITLQGDVRYHYECDVFCVSGNVFYVQSSDFGVIPYIAMGGSQSNVTLTKAVDGSLIAKIDGSSAGLIFIVPVWGASHAWARFPRVGD
ncbi:MAG: hypothetical protein DUW69_002259 [Verrucomicrobia bacterium]|jgi:hypothetical protein|nr:MAG: hypothetical protein DUW69_002259 [Verrucomicrobiota bacterium]